MRKLLYAGLVSVSLLAGGSASAQTTGGIDLGGLGGGATGGGGGTGGPTGTLGNPNLVTPTITAQDTTATNTAVLNQSNIFRVYYANPYFQGRAGSTTSQAPGGFGTPLYGTTGGAGAGAGRAGGAAGGGFGGTAGGFGGGATGIGTGAAGGRTAGAGGFGGQGGTGGFGAAGGRGGAAGGFGGQGAFGGLGGLGGANAAAQVVPLPRQIAYTATFRFPVQPVTMPRMVTDARMVLDRSTMLPNAAGIALTAEGTALVLRGTVANEDDARLAENLIRLTPGVREIRNELKFPVVPQP